MTGQVSVTAKIQVTLEIDWPHSYGEKASAVDIYTTAAKECEHILRGALTRGEVRYRIIGDIKPLMVILPVSK